MHRSLKFKNFYGRGQDFKVPICYFQEPESLTGNMTCNVTSITWAACFVTDKVVYNGAHMKFMADWWDPFEVGDPVEYRLEHSFMMDAYAFTLAVSNVKTTDPDSLHTAASQGAKNMCQLITKDTLAEFKVCWANSLPPIKHGYYGFAI